MCGDGAGADRPVSWLTRGRVRRVAREVAGVSPVVNTLYLGAPAMVWQLAAVLVVVAAVGIFWAGPAAHAYLSSIAASDKRAS